MASLPGTCFYKGPTAEVPPRAGRGLSARPLYSQHDREKWGDRFSEMIRLKE
jgi:hypothetical protein